MNIPPSVDSKPLTQNLNPLDATLMKNIGVGPVIPLFKFQLSMEDSDYVGTINPALVSLTEHGSRLHEALLEYLFVAEPQIGDVS